jgi:serine/threonine protein kinase
MCGLLCKISRLNFFLSPSLTQSWQRGIQLGKVVIKTALPNRLDRECKVLKRFRDHPSLRPLLDEIREPPCLVLKHLDDNVLNASNSKRFGKSDIKLVTRMVLEALEAFHNAGIVNTGMLNCFYPYLEDYID